MTEAGSALSSSFEELLDACVCFHRQSSSNANEERSRVRRADLADFAGLFHGQCGSLTPAVQKSIDRLKSGNCIVLMTAHQPNFFAYSGVLRKATLNSVLAKKLETLLQVPVVSFFGIADQDFSDDRWVRSCELPSVLRSEGVLPIEVHLPEKLMLNRVKKPSNDSLFEWKSEIEKWLDDSARSIVRLLKTLGLKDELSGTVLQTLKGNLSSFWKITEDCWDRSEKYSDFNGFLLSKIVNDSWEYDTVFARFSECQQAFADDFSFLLSRFSDYSRLMKEAMSESHGESASGGVSDQEPYLAPFWYHCSCGSKAKLFLSEKEGHLFGSGNCIRCQEYYDLDLGPAEKPNIAGLAQQVSARAISMALVFFNGLQPTCYVGGAGGVGYLAETEHVAKGLGIPFPPIVVWRPRDKYLGVGQAEAWLERKRICGYLRTQDSSAARDLLEKQISETGGRIDELEKMKNTVAEELKKDPNDENLKQQLKELSMEKTRIVKSSNLSVLCRELKILANASCSLKLVPSIIDYAVNVGLRETSVQWARHLTEIGRFGDDVTLDSALNLDIRLDELV